MLRGKYVSLDKLNQRGGRLRLLRRHFGWDVADVLYDNARVTCWHTGYPTFKRARSSTLRSIPWEPGAVARLADFRGADGAAHPACPRSLLKQVTLAPTSSATGRCRRRVRVLLFKETRDRCKKRRSSG